MRHLRSPLRSRFLLRSRITAAIAAAVALTLVSACGDSNTAAGPPSDSTYIKVGPTSGPSTDWSDGGYQVDPSGLRCTGPAPDPTRGITDTSITVGGLAYLTSPTGSSMVGSDVGAKIRFDRANAEGGVNGRTIDFIGVLDDGQDAARNGAQAKALVDQRKVFAAVPVMVSHTSYVDTFCDQKVPFFGWGLNEGFCGTAVGFGITGCQFAGKSVAANNLAGLINAMFDGPPAKRSIAIIGIDVDSSRRGVETLRTYAEAAGLDVVYAENPVPASGLTDPTPVVNALMTADGGAPPDVVYHVADVQSMLKVNSALKAAGYSGQQISPTYDPRLTALGDLDGMYGTVGWLPAIDDTNPAVAQLIADFKKYAPDQVISLAAMAGYWSADLFLTAATAVGRDLTVDTLLSKLNDNYVHDGAGAVPETRWPLNHFVTTPCTALVQLKDKAFRSVTPLSCGSLLVKRS